MVNKCVPRFLIESGFFLRIYSEEIAVYSEAIPFSSEEIHITSEEIPFSSEEISLFVQPNHNQNVTKQ